MNNGLSYVKYFRDLKEYFLDSSEPEALGFWKRVKFSYSVKTLAPEEFFSTLICVHIFIVLNNKRYFLGVFSPEDLKDFYPVVNAVDSFYTGYKCCYDYLTNIDLAVLEVL